MNDANAAVAVAVALAIAIAIITDRTAVDHDHLIDDTTIIHPNTRDAVHIAADITTTNLLPHAPR